MLGRAGERYAAAEGSAAVPGSLQEATAQEVEAVTLERHGKTYSLDDCFSIIFTDKGRLLLSAEHFWEALEKLGLCGRTKLRRTQPG